MAVKKNLVSNWDQAIEYMKGSAAAATRGVCPSAVMAYQGYALNYETSRFSASFDRDVFLAELAQADGVCTSAHDYKKTATAPAGSTSTAPKVDPATGGASPDITDINGAGIARAGIPWWVWLAGGGVLYLLLSKKKKGKK